MPYNVKKQVETIEAMVARLGEEIYVPLCDLEAEVYVTPEPVGFADRTSGERKTVKKGECWGNLWDCGWFHFTGKVPDAGKGKKVVLYIDIHGELCMFDKDGVPVRGLTSGSSAYASYLVRPKKREYVVAENAKGGESIDIWADAGCNDLFGAYSEVGRVELLDIAICRDNVKKVYYDAHILYGLMKELPNDCARYHRILQALFDAACKLYDYTDEEIAEADRILQAELDKKGGDADLSISATGHAHIDLAWLWPIRETKRKGVRTFATALRNMEEYPDYIFGASQPQLYAWVKEEHPALYEQVKKRIEEGRWEAQGAMWVEADTNVSGGEALIRQVLYGKRFYREEFGKEIETLHLPDVFGYSGALPQILKKSKVPYFLTIKLSWSQHNVHPHHTFLWQGIDGSEVLAHMPPEGEYNSDIEPWSIKKTERNYLDKAVCDEAVMLYGIGDGGGGPGETHLEALKREKNLSGLIPVKQDHTVNFFHRLEKNRKRYQIFHGELYLEKHQGTYTTQARNKKYNRKMEYLLRETEFAAIAKGAAYPAEALERIWKEVLLYQFHDILPGSSIKRVYDESLERYATLYEETEHILKGIYGNGGYAINSLSWERTEWVKKDGQWYRVTVPSMGSALLSDGTESKECSSDNTAVLENDCVKVTFDDTGAIISVFDKAENREVLSGASNQFALYYDDGDCWDFPETYRDRAPKFFALTKSEAAQDGPVRKVVQEYTFGESKLRQTISITDGSPMVRFDTWVDWKESKKMLRTAFYTTIDTDEVSCDIQYGNIKRPTRRSTSWDMAKYEICAHKYVDLSDNGYGVALMNDCKYGYCVKDGMMDMNILRSPSYPGEMADIAEHTFSYALYPHKHDLAHSDVVKKSYEFNVPMYFGDRVERFLQVTSPNVIVESVKKAEDSDAVIVRLYEYTGAPAVCGVAFQRPVKQAYLVDIMEEDEREVDLSQIPFGGFEIHTLKVMF